MSHSVEELYLKVNALHEKTLMLHRERYRMQGSYDKDTCKNLVDDIKSLARDIVYGPIDLDRDFSK